MFSIQILKNCPVHLTQSILKISLWWEQVATIDVIYCMYIFQTCTLHKFVSETRTTHCTLIKKVSGGEYYTVKALFRIMEINSVNSLHVHVLRLDHFRHFLLEIKLLQIHLFKALTSAERNLLQLTRITGMTRAISWMNSSYALYKLVRYSSEIVDSQSLDLYGMSQGCN